MSNTQTISFIIKKNELIKLTNFFTVFFLKLLPFYFYGENITHYLDTLLHHII